MVSVTEVEQHRQMATWGREWQVNGPEAQFFSEGNESVKQTQLWSLFALEVESWLCKWYDIAHNRNLRIYINQVSHLVTTCQYGITFQWTKLTIGDFPNFTIEGWVRSCEVCPCAGLPWSCAPYVYIYIHYTNTWKLNSWKPKEFTNNISRPTP